VPTHDAKTPSLDIALPAPGARAQLIAVRAEVERRAKLAQRDERPVVVFDIDDTLLRWPTPGHPQTPIPGALAYVSSLKSAGATIVYMTGRHENARATTENELRTFGFPLGKDEVLLLNDSVLHPLDYKANATRLILPTLGTTIAAFDNEKENARMFRRVLPDPSVSVIRLRTTSQHPDPGGEGPIVVVDDFSSALPNEARAQKAITSPP
jgi:hypothetical protein